MSTALSRLATAVLAFLLGVTLTAGTAYAASPLTAKQVKKIAAKVVKKQAPSLSVARAETLAGYEVLSRFDTLPGPGTTYSAPELSCPQGKRAVGGGALLSTFQATVSQSGPTADGTGWDVAVVRLSGNADVSIIVRVICLPV